MPAQIIQMMAFTRIMAIWTPAITLWAHLKRLFIKIPGKWHIFSTGPISEFLISQVMELYPSLRVIPTIYGGSALYMVVMQWVSQFPGKSIIGNKRIKNKVFIQLFDF